MAQQYIFQMQGLTKTFPGGKHTAEAEAILRGEAALPF